jgi:hypothetical protein
MITKKCFDKKRIKPQHYLTPENEGFTGILVVFYVFFITASFSDAECSFPHAEMLEDVVEGFLRGDLAAGDVA